MRQKFKDLIIKHEGLKLHPYKCTAGKTTIGVGRNLEDRGLSHEECLYLLDNDIMEAMKSLVQFRWFTLLNEARQAVLVNMYINLGPKGLRNFKKFISYLEQGNYEAASKEMMDSKWAKQVGDGPGKKFDRAEELALIMEKGEI